MNDFDTIIIGGGLAGLTAANLLVKKGQRVAVYEKATALGGRAQARKEKGYTLNLGPHALYKGNAGLRILKALGIRPAGKIPVFGKRPLALTPNGTALLPVTPATMLKSSLLKGKKLALLKGLMAVFFANTDALKTMSWDDWLNQTISDPIVRDYLEFSGRLSTYANAPNIMSAGETIAQIKSATTINVLYLDNGWRQLVDALSSKLAQANVPVFRKTRVTTIDAQANGVIVSLADGTQVSATHVILAVTPKDALALLPQSNALAAAVANIQPIQAACLTVGLSRLPNPDTVLAQGVGLPVYMVVQSESAVLAPANSALIHTAYYISPDDAQSAQEHRAILENVLDITQPNWRDVVDVTEFLPRITVTHAYADAAQSRPSIEVADVPNVFIIGDWVQSGEMLADGSFASAEQVVAQITS